MEGTLPIIVKYVDSLVGVAALVIATLSIYWTKMADANRKIETDRQEKAFNEISTRLTADYREIRTKVDSNDSEAADRFQFKNMCEAQHKFLNLSMDSQKEMIRQIERRQDGFDKKLDEHTKQILTAIKGKI